MKERLQWKLLKDRPLKSDNWKIQCRTVKGSDALHKKLLKQDFSIKQAQLRSFSVHTKCQLCGIILQAW